MTSTTAPIDDTRYFPTSHLARYEGKSLPSRERLIAFASDVTEQCYDSCHPEESDLGSLYCGNLGPQVYLRLQWALHRDTQLQQKKEGLLRAKQAAETSMKDAMASSSAKRRVTLLESRWVGSMAMSIVINHHNTEDHTTMIEKLERRLAKACQNLNAQECEVLYGRAGAMQAMLWLRDELQLPTLGRSFCLDMAAHILTVGMKNATAASHLKLPLVWYWHDNLYLGAAHGIVGILQTLLQLEMEEWNELERRVPSAHRLVEQTIDALYQHFCFGGSGNLLSSVGSSKKDRLVHWCHGAPGWILLLIRASQVFSKPSYLEVARNTAMQTLVPRGLLKKGLGLCHGIAGNGFVFLRLAQVLEGEERVFWHHRALQYAAFGMDHYDELREIPDRPYSLYEGLSGFVCFLLACADNDDAKASRFPLYDF